MPMATAIIIIFIIIVIFLCETLNGQHASARYQRISYSVITQDLHWLIYNGTIELRILINIIHCFA